MKAGLRIIDKLQTNQPCSAWPASHHFFPAANPLPPPALLSVKTTRSFGSSLSVTYTSSPLSPLWVSRFSCYSSPIGLLAIPHTRSLFPPPGICNCCFLCLEHYSLKTLHCYPFCYLSHRCQPSWLPLHFPSSFIFPQLTYYIICSTIYLFTVLTSTVKGFLSFCSLALNKLINEWMNEWIKEWMSFKFDYVCSIRKKEKQVFCNERDIICTLWFFPVYLKIICFNQ